MLISNVFTQNFTPLLKKTVKNIVLLTLPSQDIFTSLMLKFDCFWSFACFVIPQCQYNLLLEVVLFFH